MSRMSRICLSWHPGIHPEAKFVGLSVPHEPFWSSEEGSDGCPQDPDAPDAPDADESAGAEHGPGSTCLEGQDEAVTKKRAEIFGEEIWGNPNLRRFF